MKFLTDHSRALSVCFLLVWGGIVYANTLGVPFYFDDVLNIVGPPALHLKEFSAAALGKVIHGAHLTTRPVANLSFALNYYFHGVDVGGYHLVNLAIHLLCAVLAYFIFRQTLALAAAGTGGRNERLISFFAALIWLVHPVNTQTVTYVVQRMNGLAALFFLLSFFCYISGRQSESGKTKTWCFIAALCSWFLALGSKETAAVLPVVILLYEWLFFHKGDSGWLKRNIPLIVVFCGVLLLPVFIYAGLNPLNTVLSGYEVRDFSLVERLLTQARVVVHYVSLLFYPAESRLSLEHDFAISASIFDPLSTFIALTGIVAVMGLALLRVKDHRLLSFAILWFFINLALESSLIPLEIIFEHRTYLPYVFPLLVVVQLAFAATNHKNVNIGLLAVVVLLFSVVTMQRNNVWREPVAFWRQTVAVAPENARANNYLGMALSDVKKYDEALPYYREAVRLRPRYYHAHNNLGAALLGKGLFGEARQHLLFAANGKGVKDEAYNNLGMAYASQRDLARALKYFRLALASNSDNPDIHNNLGGVFAELGQFDKASYHLKQALKADPDNANSHSNLGHIAALTGQPARAAVHYREALRLNPGQVNARKGLAALYRSNPALKIE